MSRKQRKNRRRAQLSFELRQKLKWLRTTFPDCVVSTDRDGWFSVHGCPSDQTLVCAKFPPRVLHLVVLHLCSNPPVVRILQTADFACPRKKAPNVPLPKFIKPNEWRMVREVLSKLSKLSDEFLTPPEFTTNGIVVTMKSNGELVKNMFRYGQELYSSETRSVLFFGPLQIALFYDAIVNPLSLLHPTASDIQTEKLGYILAEFGKAYALKADGGALQVLMDDLNFARFKSSMANALEAKSWCFNNMTLEGYTEVLIIMNPSHCYERIWNHHFTTNEHPLLTIVRDELTHKILPHVQERLLVTGLTSIVGEYLDILMFYKIN